MYEDLKRAAVAVIRGKATGFDRVEAEFSGGGDEGSFDVITGKIGEHRIDITDNYSNPIVQFLEAIRSNHWSGDGPDVVGTMTMDKDGNVRVVGRIMEFVDAPLETY